MRSQYRSSFSAQGTTEPLQLECLLTVQPSVPPHCARSPFGGIIEGLGGPQATKQIGKISIDLTCF